MARIGVKSLKDGELMILYYIISIISIIYFQEILPHY
jgi:hypothetical protein